MTVTTRPTVVILDDDPTGTQAVADIAVITTSSPDALTWAFDTSPEGFFVLTNSRSLGECEMRALTLHIVDAVLKAAAGRPVRFVSRSDSTLRGHIFAEVAAIADGMRAHGLAPGRVVFAPAFPRAGRTTEGGMHHVREGGRVVPAHASHYATDATFGYTTSSLQRLVVERSDGILDEGEVTVVPAGGPLADALVDPATRWVVCDASNEDDLRHIADAVEHADPTGTATIVRCSPGLLPALLHRPPSDQVRPQPPAVPESRGGLIVVGSHVAEATAQLHALLAEPDVDLVTLDVEILVDIDDTTVAEVVAPVIARVLERIETHTVVLATTRSVHRWDDPQRSLAFARRVSSALVETTRRVLDHADVRFVIAKGGITSSDITTRALGVERAIVSGRVGAGIAWHPVGALSDAPLVLVPGNIGDENGLRDALRALR